MKHWITRKWCSLVSLVVPVSIIILVDLLLKARGHGLHLWVESVVLFTICVLWYFLSFLLFPRIVVTLKPREKPEEKHKESPEETKSPGEHRKLVLWIEGRKVYDKRVSSLPMQVSFQVWRRERYDLAVKWGDSWHIEEGITTYDQKTSHVSFELP